MGEPITIKNDPVTNIDEKNKLKNFLRIIRGKYLKIKEKIKCNKKKAKSFTEFNKYIKFSRNTFNFITKNEEYDIYIVGSDQVWNPNFHRLRDFDLLTFTDSENKIALAASFGIDELEKQYEEKVGNALDKFNIISVREEQGKKIIEKILNRNDVEVILDPTMLIETEKWDKVMTKPIMMEILKNKKYIFNYFLGELSEKKQLEIKRIARQNNCEIINVLDKTDPFYTCGPSEFLYLEKNAFLICTDSFHSTVFAMLFRRPFIVFDREDSNVKMNSRLETLLKKFLLEDRWFNNKIEDKILTAKYDIKEILEDERKRARKLLEFKEEKK